MKNDSNNLRSEINSAAVLQRKIVAKMQFRDSGLIRTAVHFRLIAVLANRSHR